MRTAARFPQVPRDAGHYESFYIKACAPEGGRGLWIRHTVHKRPGAEPTGSIWFTAFDRDRGGPRATKLTVPAAELGAEDGYISVAGASLSPGAAAGSIASDALRASWELSFRDLHEPLRHLPSERMYEARIPRTKLLSPHPGSIWSGTVEIDGESAEIDGWPGMIGHNWGAEHAERWIWMHAGALDGGEEGDFLDIGAGRIKLGPLTTPWIANGAISLGGELIRLGGPARIYGTQIDEAPTRCEFTIPGRRVTIRGSVSAPSEQFVGWIYADPDGSEHNTVNCSVADMELRVERPDHRHLHLRCAGGAAYELGMRETDHGIPIQPYPDG